VDPKQKLDRAQVSMDKYKSLVYEGWTWRGTPTLNTEQSLEDENITTLIACTGETFYTAQTTRL
jgi:hypothetical protein